MPGRPDESDYLRVRGDVRVEGEPEPIRAWIYVYDDARLAASDGAARVAGGDGWASWPSRR